MTRPVLGIIACNRQVDGEAALTVIERYARASMAYGDCAVLIVPSMDGLMSARDVASRLDGILLTGSPTNVEPSLYGAAQGDGPFDPRRDAMALGLIDEMASLGRPIFGICRGFQEINVALGGSLRGDAASNPDLLRHHSVDDHNLAEMFKLRHKVDLTEGGLLSKAMGQSQIDVISVHYQAIDRLASGVNIEARASDGIIEAFSGHIGKAPMLAVQWHPEWKTPENSDSQIFFKLLGRALRGEGVA